MSLLPLPKLSQDMGVMLQILPGMARWANAGTEKTVIERILV